MGSVFVSPLLPSCFVDDMLPVTFGRLPLVARFCTFPLWPPRLPRVAFFTFRRGFGRTKPRSACAAVFFSVTELADRRLIPNPYQLIFPSGIECGGDSVAFAAVTLDAEVGREAARDKVVTSTQAESVRIDAFKIHRIAGCEFERFALHDNR